MAAPTPKPPPPEPPTFIFNPSEVLSAADTAILRFEQLLDHLILNVSTQQASFANIVTPLAEGENALLHETRRLVIYRSVSPDPEMRKASITAQALFDNLSFKTLMNEQLYKLLIAVEAKEESISPECSYLLQGMIRARVRVGLSISTDSTRTEFQIIQRRLSSIKSQFRENISQAEHDIWLSGKELDGLDQSFIESLPKSIQRFEMKVQVSLQDSIFYKILFNVHDDQVRKRVYIAHANRCKKNINLFREAIVLRHKLAQLLMYPDYATMVLEDRMAKSPYNVHAYLTELLSLLTPFGRKEMDKLRKTKKHHHEVIGKTFDGKIYPWDEYYYRKLQNKSIQTQLAAGNFSEYFSLIDILPRILEIFGTFFGIRFVPLEQTSFPPQSTSKKHWGDDVVGFAVWDCEEFGEEFLGYLYLDLIEREGKVQTPSAFAIEPGYTTKDGTRHYPVVALTSSLEKPTTEKPTLMKHAELILLVHEFGHGIHDLVSKTKYARFHGSDGTTIDFGEAPSQLLERWCWIPSVLKSIGRHYTSLSPTYLNAWKRDNKESCGPPVKMPDDMIERLVGAKHHKGALFHLNQLHWCFFDMAVHEPQKHGGIESLNIATLFNRTRKTVYPTDQDESLGDEWGHGYTHFEHAMGEYGAGYYSYLFSNAYAADIFYSKFLHGKTIKNTGFEYRRNVLEKGGSQSEMVTLEEYLGRKPHLEAFFRELELEERNH